MHKIYIDFSNQENGYCSAALMHIIQRHEEAEEYYSLSRILDEDIDLNVNDFMKFEDILAKMEIQFIPFITRERIIDIINEEQSTQKIIEHVQKKLNEYELNQIKKIDIFDSTNQENEDTRRKVLQIISDMSGYDSENIDAQVEIAIIYEKLQDELVAQFHFSKELVENFKQKPKSFAYALCLEDANEVAEKENIRNAYVLLKYYEYSNLVIIFFTCGEDEFQLIEYENNFFWNEEKELLELYRANNLIYVFQKLTIEETSENEAEDIYALRGLDESMLRNKF